MKTTLLPKYYWHSLVIGAVLFVMWDLSRFDVPLEHLFFDQQSTTFPFKEHWFFTSVLHQGIKFVLWLGVLWILIASALPASLRLKVPVFGQYSRQSLWALCIVLLLPAIVVGVLKSRSMPYCPWEVAGFGGSNLHYDWWQVFTESVVKKGRCWPAGHASGGFGLLALYFFARAQGPNWVARALYFALFIGFVMGLAQQVRGAHFMSHTLWTLWFAWLICGVGSWCLQKWLQQGSVLTR